MSSAERTVSSKLADARFHALRCARPCRRGPCPARRRASSTGPCSRGTPPATWPSRRPRRGSFEAITSACEVALGEALHHALQVADAAQDVAADIQPHEQQRADERRRPHRDHHQDRKRGQAVRVLRSPRPCPTERLRPARFTPEVEADGQLACFLQRQVGELGVVDLLGAQRVDAGLAVAEREQLADAILDLHVDRSSFAELGELARRSACGCPSARPCTSRSCRWRSPAARRSCCRTAGSRRRAACSAGRCCPSRRALSTVPDWCRPARCSC